MQLKVVTWNIFAGKDVEGVITLLKELDADVIALQEILQEVGGTNNQAEQIAKALGMHFVYAPAHTLTPGNSYVLDYFHISRPMDWGNAVLSKRAITNSKVHQLSKSLGRIALQASIPFEEGTLEVFSTHLTSGSTERAQNTRLEQAQNLLPIIPSSSAILMGDFNADPQSDVFATITSALVSTETDPSRVPTQEGRQIDYIFTTPEFRVRATTMPRSEASDHYPLVAELEK